MWNRYLTNGLPPSSDGASERTWILFGMVPALSLLLLVVDVPASTGAITHRVRGLVTQRQEEAYVLSPDVRERDLIAIVRGVMEKWPPAPRELPAISVEDVARACAEAALARGSDAPQDDAILLASLAYWEGARFAVYVDEGACDDRVWRSSPSGIDLMRRWGDCDGGRAHSLWQIHPIDALGGPLADLCSSSTVDESRLGASRCALELAARSMNAWGSLAGYTGESPWGAHPKADARLKWAREAMR